MSIAVNKTYTTNGETREEVSFFNCVVWGKLCDVLRQYAGKGKQVSIDGRLRQNRWQDQASGQTRSVVEIVVDNLQLLGGSQQEGQGSPVGAGANLPQKEEERTPMDDAMSLPEGHQPDLLDDDIPF